MLQPVQFKYHQRCTSGTMARGRGRILTWKGDELTCNVKVVKDNDVSYSLDIQVNINHRNDILDVE